MIATNTQFKFENGENIFFTSDTHFSHENILKFCHRSFKDVSHMNEELIKRWNEKIGPDDIVFHLGDFAWGGSEKWNSILDRLNGHKYLIIGNHDEKNLKQGCIDKFKWVGYQAHVYIERQGVYLNHYPFLCYTGSDREDGPWQLFGHVHSGPLSTSNDIPRLTNLYPSQYDVGVDNNNYYPVSWNEIKTIINKQKDEFNRQNKVSLP